MKQHQWHLEFSTPPHPRPIQLGDQLLSMGSCFAQRLGVKWQSLRLPITLNPFGISFDPLSLARQLNYLSGGTLPEDSFEHLGLWRHYDWHGEHAQISEEELSEHLKKQLLLGREAYQNSRWLVLTLGTAFYFQTKKEGRPVANCHKLPGDQFERKLASVEELIQALSPAIRHFLDQDDDREVVISVSPVRHIRDGLTANSRSKARLLEVCHSLSEQHERVYYIPAYEWWMDVWRDHRFYAEDLVHPSEQSVEWMMDEFIQSHASEELKVAIEELQAFYLLENHRSLHPGSAQDQERMLHLKKRREYLQNKYPLMDG